MHNYFSSEALRRANGVSSVKLQQGTRQLTVVSPSPEHPGHSKGVFDVWEEDLWEPRVIY